MGRVRTEEGELSTLVEVNMSYDGWGLADLESFRNQVKQFIRMGWSKCHLDDVEEAIRKRREAIQAEPVTSKPRRRSRPSKRYPKRRKGEPWGEWYARYLKSPHWQDLRAAKLAEVGDRCEQCGSVERLQIHHLTYVNLRHEMPEDLQVLCDDCHNDAHGYSTRLDDEFRSMFR